jgi:GTP-binding protein Era
MGKSGFVALVGRPNSGKSTLLNLLLKEKVSIVSSKPQTTRHKILGILNRDEGQVVIIDTPGIHKPGFELNRRMMQVVEDSLEGADLLLLLVDASIPFGKGDQFVLEMLRPREIKTILLLNKMDLIPKAELLPFMARYSELYPFVEIVPLSALRGENLDLLVDLILKYLPEGPPYFPEDQHTDQTERSLVAELVREKVLEQTEQELPYSTTVQVTQFEDREDLAVIHCDIYVERDSQKKIVIGKGGTRLKQIGMEARPGVEEMLQKRVYLELFVKVKPHWRDDPRFLNAMKLGEEK